MNIKYWFREIVAFLIVILVVAVLLPFFVLGEFGTWLIKGTQHEIYVVVKMFFVVVGFILTVPWLKFVILPIIEFLFNINLPFI